mgnify:CR=1 FL=1
MGEPQKSSLGGEDSKVGDKGAVAIADNAVWTNLKYLDLSGSDEGCIVLATSARWKQLRELNLSFNDVRWKGLLALSLNSTWTRRKEAALYINPKLRRKLERKERI